MTFNELIAQVSANTGMAKEGVKKILDALIATLAEKAGAGEDAVLPGFGQFKVKDVPGAPGSQSQHRRGYGHPGISEGRLHARQGAQGCAEDLTGRKALEKVRTADSDEAARVHRS